MATRRMETGQRSSDRRRMMDAFGQPNPRSQRSSKSPTGKPVRKNEAANDQPDRRRENSFGNSPVGGGPNTVPNIAEPWVEILDTAGWTVDGWWWKEPVAEKSFRWKTIKSGRSNFSGVSYGGLPVFGHVSRWRISPALGNFPLRKSFSRIWQSRVAWDARESSCSLLCSQRTPSMPIVVRKPRGDRHTQGNRPIPSHFSRLGKTSFFRIALRPVDPCQGQDTCVKPQTAVGPPWPL